MQKIKKSPRLRRGEYFCLFRKFCAARFALLFLRHAVIRQREHLGDRDKAHGEVLIARVELFEEGDGRRAEVADYEQRAAFLRVAHELVEALRDFRLVGRVVEEAAVLQRGHSGLRASS